MKASHVILCLLGLVVVGCGIPAESSPEPLILEIDEPPEIREPSPEDQAAVSMYLVRDDRLIHVTRDLRSPSSIEEIVGSLLGGVTPPEERANLRTSIPRGTRLLSVAQEGSTVRVNLSREFASVGGEEEILAVAQIVLTVTSLEETQHVAFELEGIPTDVPVANGALSVEPVSAREYDELLDP